MIKNLIFLLLVTIHYTAYNQKSFHQDSIRSIASADLAPFYHGVASGDPLHNSVILWTRVTTDSNDALVKYRIATDTCMNNVVDSGWISTNASKDYCVKVNVQNLQPFTWYYYEFEAYGLRSIRGRTRTLPAGDVDSLRFAVVSCSDYTKGYFNAYQKIMERNDVFAVIHLGDYIYEKETVIPIRQHDPDYDAWTLSDYRMRHSQYKLDQDLMRLHQQYPFFSTWDDHEVVNDSWYGGSSDHDPMSQGNYFDRKAAGLRAYEEWMPLRLPDPADTQRIYRNFRFGDLIDLYMMDTRFEGREEQNGIDNSMSRTMLGNQQRHWFLNSIDSSNAQWQVMAQQVMMAPINVQPIPFLPPIYYSEDSWDGYSAERQKIWDTVLNQNIQNFVVLTGDIHTAWANDLPANNYQGNNGNGSAGVEFVCPSITSQASPINIGISLIQNINDHVKFTNLSEHGYVILDINKQRTQGEFWFINTILFNNTAQNFAGSWTVTQGQRHLQSTNTPSSPSTQMQGVKAPWNIRGSDTNCFVVTPPVDTNDTNIITHLLDKSSGAVLLGIYPNPFYEQTRLHFSIDEPQKVQYTLYSLTGSILEKGGFGTLPAGLHEETISFLGLSPGMYYLKIEFGNRFFQRTLIKTD